MCAGPPESSYILLPAFGGGAEPPSGSSLDKLESISRRSDGTTASATRTAFPGRPPQKDCRSPAHRAISPAGSQFSENRGDITNWRRHGETHNAPKPRDGYFGPI